MVARRLATLLPVAAALALPAAASADTGVAVRFAADATAAERAAALRAADVATSRVAGPGVRVGATADPAGAAAALRDRPGVAWAAPNAIARASAAGFYPSDPGRPEDGSWQAGQWHLAGPEGVRAPEAWRRLRDRGRPGGRGVTVAVLDTGVAYRDAGPYRRSPALRRTRFVRPLDAVEGDRRPDDDAGHGTHVAATIAENVSDGEGGAGLAYGVRIMPVKVLRSNLAGDAVGVARGIRWAARRGADVINLSMEFDADSSRAALAPVRGALREARRRGVVVVGTAGNGGTDRVAYPASEVGVLGVGASTERGCRAEYSSAGAGLDLVAPGGGGDSTDGADPRCRPTEPAGRAILQTTFASPGARDRFALSSRFVGTSQAAAQVSAAAALVRASRVAGADPSPARVARSLTGTAADRGPAGRDDRYGHGRLDAAAAVGVR